MNHVNFKHLCVLTIVALYVFPSVFAAIDVSVSQVALYIRNEVVETVDNPASALVVSLPQEPGEHEISVSVVASNPTGAIVAWHLWSGLSNTVITGRSSNGIVGGQSEDTWTYIADDQKLILSIAGTLDFNTLAAGKLTTLVQLSYGQNQFSIQPLLTLSVEVASTDDIDSGTSAKRVDAEAAIGQLSVEINESPIDLPIDLSYYQGQLYRSQVYFERGNYNKGLEIAQTALDKLREEKAYQQSPIRLISRSVESYWFVAVVPLAIIAGALILRGKKHTRSLA